LTVSLTQPRGFLIFPDCSRPRLLFVGLSRFRHASYPKMPSTQLPMPPTPGISDLNTPTREEGDVRSALPTSHTQKIMSQKPQMLLEIFRPPLTGYLHRAWGRSPRQFTNSPDIFSSQPGTRRRCCREGLVKSTRILLHGRGLPMIPRLILRMSR